MLEDHHTMKIPSALILGFLETLLLHKSPESNPQQTRLQIV